MNKPLRIPTIIGLLLVIMIIGSVILVSERVFRPSPRASLSTSPANVTITNVTDSSFTVTWTTQAPSSGTVVLSSSQINNAVHYDERDVKGKVHKYITHSVPIQNLKPNMLYSIILLSDGKRYDDNGSPYTLTTPPTLLINPSSLEPAYGTISSTTDTPIEGALVYLTLDGSQELSALTKSSGAFIIPLNQTRTQDLASYITESERITENITVRYNEQDSYAITDTLNDAPVPEMMLGKTYDFRKLQAENGSSLVAAKLPVSQVLGQTTRTHTVTLLTPKPKQAIPSFFPLFSGTGIPDTYVGITIGMKQPINGSARVDTNGLWRYTPPKALPIGIQNVTVNATDMSGKMVVITRSFEILKSGTQVLGVATPSATLTPSVTEIPVPTPEISTTATPTAIPTAQPPPTSGSDMPTIILLGIGTLFFLSGAVAFIK